MKQRGFAFVPFLLANWQLIAGGLALAGVAVYVWDCHSTKAEYAAFKADVIAKGRAAEQHERDEAALRERLSKNREADHAKEISTLNAKYRAALAAAQRLPSDSASGNNLRAISEAASVIACPDRQADAARRLERLEVGVLGLLDRGNQAIARTITCKGFLDDQLAVEGN